MNFTDSLLTDYVENYVPPTIFRLSRPADVTALEALEHSGVITARHDMLTLQLENLAKIRTPERGRLGDRDDVFEALVAGRPRTEIGAWVFYPWSGKLVHILDEPEFVEVRTAANRNKITTAEQLTLAGKTVGILGLSVGNAVALTIAAERSAGGLKLADFDEMDLSNLNRLRAGIADLGVNKAALAARQIAEMDPYLEVEVFNDGIDDLNIDDFFDAGCKVDLLVEECDMPWIKILSREHARQRGIPVLMEASDRGMLDIERFDLEPERPLLHGLVGDLSTEELETMDRDGQLAAMATIVGVDGLSDRTSVSVVEMDSTLTTWPQLASEVNHGGAVVATVARAILLGHDVPSSRRHVELPFGTAQTPYEKRTPATVSEPEAAVEQLPGDLREILELAMLSPSGGNTQQWQFVVRSRVIDVVHLPERSRTHQLFEGRETVRRVVLGTVTESIVVAARARGLTAEVEYDPEGDDSLVYTRITVGENGPAATAAEIALGAALSSRYSERTREAGRPLTDAEMSALHLAVEPYSARLWLSGDDLVKYVYGEGTAIGNRLRTIVAGLHTETFDEFYFRSDEPDRKDGVPLENLGILLPERIALRILSRPAVAKFLHERGEGMGLLEYTRTWAAGASAVGAVTAAGHSRRDFVEAGRAVQRMWLAATALGVGVHPTTSLMFEAEMLDLPEGEVFSALERAEIDMQMAEFRKVLVTDTDAPLAIVFRAVAGAATADLVRTPRRPLALHLDIRTATSE
ncbi:Rv1355c family protein [Nocardia sp. SYP-A9097]|uniref:Rv1355c family protein n=1 Tax=Nocardia sp. SYP-A9097 TaxID=2663237 RepID=UPI00129BA858|nr:Rv1355c family protein [Nocardia sp. SYP-A9097]MRH87964.1 Rv1355c family protein [Nocardia sp. SYP-A9097]